MKKNNSGFTLIEIIVVLIIVGVLAAIALPNLFSNIGKSKGAEALAMMGAIKTNIESCIQINSGSAANCRTVANLGYPSQQGVFSYNIPATNAGGAWQLVAIGTAVGQAGTISFNRIAGGTITCSAAGAFAGIC